MRYPEVKEKTVLVTGCSSGIGAVTADLLKERGWRVWPTARKETDLAVLRDKGFTPIPLNVADPDSVQVAVDTLLQQTGGRLGALVNNAGFGQPGAVEDLSRETLRYQFEVNLFGMQDLTNRVVPVLRKQGYGRIVNISSVVGRVALPFFGSYSATKFAMEALADSMRVELRGSGISISLVEPGPIATAFGQNSVQHVEGKLDLDHSPFGPAYRHVIDERRRKSIKDPFTKPPEDVAAKVLHALEAVRPRTRYCVTVPAYAGALMRRLFPDRLVDRILAERWSKHIGPDALSEGNDTSA